MKFSRKIRLRMGRTNSLKRDKSKSALFLNDIVLFAFGVFLNRRFPGRQTCFVQLFQHPTSYEFDIRVGLAASFLRHVFHRKGDWFVEGQFLTVYVLFYISTKVGLQPFETTLRTLKVLLRSYFSKVRRRTNFHVGSNT